MIIDRDGDEGLWRLCLLDLRTIGAQNVYELYYNEELQNEGFGLVELRDRRSILSGVSTE